MVHYTEQYHKHGHRCLLRLEDEGISLEDFLKGIGEKGAISGSAVPAAYKSTSTYVYRKMGQTEFELTMKNQKLQWPYITNPRNKYNGEKWMTESVQHTREFKQQTQSCPNVVEIQVNKFGYKNIKKDAIPQKGSFSVQPKGKEVVKFNITNKERLAGTEKINLGLKGGANVDKFNESVISVSKVNPERGVHR
uniref:Uncharacterized protein n=1 Tax=Clytia hemisphaerica TaxID=252671 RepID=A0A7M5V751_9CNID